MEKKTFLALALSMVVLIAWPFLSGTNKKQNNTPVATEQTSEKGTEQLAKNEEVKTVPASKEAKIISGGKTYFIENNFLRIGLNSNGAVISEVIFKDYRDDNKEFIRFFGKDVENRGFFHVSNFNNKTFSASVSKDMSSISFVDQTGNEVSYLLEKDSHILKASIKRSNITTPLSFEIYSKISESKDLSYGLSSDPDARNKTVVLYSSVSDKVSRTDLSKVKDKGVIYFSNSFKWVALSDRYFMTSVVDKNDSFSDVSSKCTKEGFCSIDFIVKNTEKVFNTALFIGPKDVSYMRVLDPSLTEAIDYGWFSFMSVPMLELMKFFYSAIPNYGIAILILTLLVRLIMFPLQHKAMKSMKRMQDLQPHLKALQEKYKGDKEKLNKEMLQFMKTHKMNPMSGCLPMLIQLPVFIALYKVLGNSVELYRSPFMFWITDLSVKDHYYILPLLMGIMMFVQQKMTPNPTMDPTQAKIMLYMMPIIFTVMMLSLPSGLTLYIMFSTLLGIIQQLATNRILSAKK